MDARSFSQITGGCQNNRNHDHDGGGKKPSGAGPVALRPELIDPGGLYGLSFDPAEPASSGWDGPSDAATYQLELD